MKKKIFHENETVELKKSTSELKEAIISIVAILNKHQKGDLYFGVRNDGTAVGQDIGERTIREISKTISDNIEPRIYPIIREETLQGKHCIVVAFEGTETPYFANGRAYIRVGDENKQLSVKELEKLILKKSKISWEEGLSEKIIDDVNEEVIRDFVTKANISKRITFAFFDVKSTLKKLNLLKGEKLLKAAEVLFCNHNPLEVQAAVFAGKDKLTFLDIKQFKGNLFDLLEQSTMYLKEHMNWRAELTGEGRNEVPEVPIRAIEETVVNSLCHRDFSNPKGNEIAFFKDRIEIYNPGQFPENHSPDDFIKGNETSILRNPLIANVLYLRKDIEKWGSGLRRIYTACKEADIKVEFKQIKTGFIVIFYRREGVSTNQRELVERLAEKLVENQRKILELVQKNPYVSKKELSLKIGISTTAIDNNIKKLKEKGLLKRVGPDKGGYWEVLHQ